MWHKYCCCKNTFAGVTVERFYFCSCTCGSFALILVMELMLHVLLLHFLCDLFKFVQCLIFFEDWEIEIKLSTMENGLFSLFLKENQIQIESLIETLH